MQNNPEIEQIIEQAVRIARERQHEYVLTEHLLMALLQHAAFRTCLIKFGVEINHFDRDLSRYLDSLTKLVKSEPTMQPRKTNALERVFNRALTQVLFTGRRTVTTADMYLAIMGETNSHAHYFLLKYGVGKAEFICLQVVELLPQQTCTWPLWAKPTVMLITSCSSMVWARQSLSSFGKPITIIPQPTA
jgi:ATP-dependent Clp protease ATP-binding subunit ClpA